MVLTDTGFATGADAVTAAQNEAMGDFVLYFNTTVNVASLLFVDALDMAHSIARFANIDSLEDLQGRRLRRRRLPLRLSRRHPAPLPKTPPHPSRRALRAPFRRRNRNGAR